MNKLTIPTILVATVMVAGIFAFMPVQQASTVHTTITLAGFEADALGVGDIATAAINADALATDAVTEISDSAYGSQIIRVFSTDLSGDTLVATSTEDFTVCYIAEDTAGAGGDITIGDGAATLTISLTANDFVDGCVGGNAGDTITIGSNVLADAYATIVTSEDAVASIG